MLYIPTNTLETAQAISKTFYELSRPESVRNGKDVTQYYCSWLVHPITQAVVLQIPDISLYIHSEADETIFDEFIQPLVDSGEIPESEITNTQTLIEVSKGKTVSIIDILPSFWKQQAKTQEQIQKENWFQSPFNLGSNNEKP